MSIVIKGGSRCNRRYFTRHLLNRKENDKVRVVACRGFARDNLPDAFEDMEVMARGTRTKNYFYQFSMNPEPGEQLMDEQFDRAEDITLKHLGLENQPRIVVEHTKKGRTHRHVAVFRIDEDGKAISDSLTYKKHEAAAREIEHEMRLKPGASVLVKDRETPRPKRNARDWEGMRGSETGINPNKVRDEVTKLREQSDGPQSFKEGLREHGYILCQGRRDFCFVDPAGKDYSLARYAGMRAHELRGFMKGLDRETLPTMEEAKKQANATGDSEAARAVRERAAQKRRRRFEYDTQEAREATARKKPEDRHFEPAEEEGRRRAQAKPQELKKDEPQKTGGGDWQERMSNRKDREPER